MEEFYAKQYQVAIERRKKNEWAEWNTLRTAWEASVKTTAEKGVPIESTILKLGSGRPLRSQVEALSSNSVRLYVHREPGWSDTRMDEYEAPWFELRFARPGFLGMWDSFRCWSRQ